MKKTILLAMLLLNILQVTSQDRIFNYTYQSSVLGKGQKEIEVWTTLLQGKENYYREIQTRVEYENGLGSNLQVAFYMNAKQKAFLDNAIGAIVMDPTEISFSNEWKYKFSDPIANKIGFAGYLEISASTDEVEIELKAIFDKKIGRILHVVNLNLEPEWITTTENGEIKTETEIKYDFNYASSYNLNKNWNLGAEFINKNVYIKTDKFTHSALFAGPTVSYSSDKFWINLTALPQITGLNNPEGMNGLNLDEFTKFQTRLIFSYAF